MSAVTAYRFSTGLSGDPEVAGIVVDDLSARSRADPCAAIDAPDSPGHVSGPIGSQKEHDRCNFVGITGTSQRQRRDPLRERFAHGGWKWLRLGVDEPRTDGVHLNVVRRELDRGNAGECFCGGSA